MTNNETTSGCTTCAGQIVDLNSVEFTEQGRSQVAKTEQFHALRLDLPRGKKIPTHHAKGPITVQCLKGCVNFFVGSTAHEMRPGHWLFLEAKTEHSLHSLEDSAMLVTKVNV